MHRDRDRKQWLRLIAQIAIRTGWSFKEVSELTAEEFGVVVEEVTGKRRMSDAELQEQLAQWRAASHSNSAPIPPS